MKNILFAVGALIIISFLSACNLEKEVEIELPEYKSQPVVECYVEPGKPVYMLLSKSAHFFAPFDTSLTDFVQNFVLQGAVVTVTHGGLTDTLDNQPYIDLESQRLYNYVARTAAAYKPGQVYRLKIILPDGGVIEGETTMPERTLIDSVVVQWSPDRDTLARALTYITDNPNETNYWRRMLNLGSLTDSIAAQDFLVRDNLNTTDKIAFGMGYDLKEGDTMYNTIFSISESYLNYLESVQLAIFGNLNPFASPSPIKSNVSGTANPLGIFTCLIYDRDTTVVRK